MTMITRDGPALRYANATYDPPLGEWQITICCDQLPIGPPVTLEYMGDSFLPVVWEAEPQNETEREFVLDGITAALEASVLPVAYEAGDAGEVYRRNEDGSTTLLAVVSHWGNAYEIVYALNAAFPGGDTSAFHAAQRAKADADMAVLVAAMQREEQET